MPKPSELAREATKLQGNIQVGRDMLEWYKSVSKGGGGDGVNNWGRNFLQQGKIYIYRYDPKTKDTLQFYDRNPMVLSLGQLRNKGEEGILDFGINLHFIPKQLREKLLDIVYKVNKATIEKEIDTSMRSEAKDQKPLSQVDYNNFQRFLSGYGFEFAFRSYYKNRRKNVYVIPYEDWHKTLFLDQEDIVGASIQQIYSDFRSAKSSGRIKNAFSRASSRVRRFLN